MLDENVPASVADMLIGLGHKAEFIRSYVPPSSPDPLVAKVSEDFDAALITFDSDFQKKIAPRVPAGQRRRFKKLSRIWLKCNEYQAAERPRKSISFIEGEHKIAKNNTDARMMIEIGNSFIKSNR